MIIKLYEMDGLTKDEALKKIQEYLVLNNITTPEYYDGILLREKEASFYIGNYISIPHAIFDYCKYIKENGLIVLRFKNAIDWDGHKVHYVIGIAVFGDNHIDVLANIANSFCEEQLTIDSLKIDINKLIESLKWE